MGKSRRETEPEWGLWFWGLGCMCQGFSHDLCVEGGPARATKIE